MSADLGEFLLARIAEDEARAPLRHVVGCELHRSEGRRACDCGLPARALAQCSALRAVVDLHAPDVHFGDTCGVCFSGDYGRLDEPLLEDFPCPTLRALVDIWRSHPDYRPEEWA